MSRVTALFGCLFLACSLSGCCLLHGGGGGCGYPSYGSYYGGYPANTSGGCNSCAPTGYGYPSAGMYNPAMGATAFAPVTTTAQMPAFPQMAQAPIDTLSTY